MSVNQGFEDLQCREILGFENGLAIVAMGEGQVRLHKLFVSPNGTVKAKPEPKADTTPDQVGERRVVPVSERWKNTDQMVHQVNPGATRT